LIFLICCVNPVLICDGAGRATLILLISQDNPDPIWDGGWRGNSDFMNLAEQLRSDLERGLLSCGSVRATLILSIWQAQGNSDLIKLAGQL
jgi:hypothetical protein